MQITIIKSESNQRGVAIQVLCAEGPAQAGWLLDTMTVQLESGELAMNWRCSGTPWAAWRPQETSEVAMDEILNRLVPAVHEVVMPVAARIWETLPTFRAPGQETDANPEPE